MLVWALASLLIGLASAHFAQKRGRDAVIWFVIGVLLGIFGVLLLFILPPASREEAIGPANHTAMSLKQTQKGESLGNWPEHSESTQDRERKPNLATIDSRMPQIEGLPANFNEVDWFYIDRSDRQQGPMFLKDLQLGYQRDNISKDTYVWCEGMEDWKKIADLNDFESLLSEEEKDKKDE